MRGSKPVNGLVTAADHGGRWARTESGLFVPDYTSSTGAPPVATKRRETRAAWIAVVISIATTILSCVGLFLQADANRRQAQALEDQLSVNNINRQNEREKYASRVTFYAKSDDSRVVVVQNRSVVPVNDVIIGAWLYDQQYTPIDKVFYRVTTVPPCTLHYVLLSVNPGTGAEYVYYDTLDFRDVNGQWHIQTSGQPATGGNGPLPGRSDRSETAAAPQFYSSESPPLAVNFSPRPGAPVERTESAQDCGGG